jgi:class 3 adenylate cyclase
MESHGLPGRIQVSEAMRDRLADRYRFEAREAVDIKGKGRMTTWLLADARRQSATAAAPLPA